MKFTGWWSGVLRRSKGLLRRRGGRRALLAGDPVDRGPLGAGGVGDVAGGGAGDDGGVSGGSGVGGRGGGLGGGGGGGTHYGEITFFRIWVKARRLGIIIAYVSNLLLSLYLSHKFHCAKIVGSTG